MTVLPAPIADLDQVANVPFNSAVDQVDQYKQAGYALHAWFRDRLGATVEMSSDGVANAGLGDFILSQANIIPGVEAVDPHSWAVYNIGGTRFVANFDGGLTITPQLTSLYRTEGPYNNDGTLTTRPTSAFADRESSVISWNMIGWGGPVAGSISFQWSAAQQIGWFWTKQAANPTTASVVFIERGALADDYRDGIRSWFIVAGASMADLYTPTLGRISGYDGTAGGSIAAHSAFIYMGSFWINGLASDGRPRLLPTHYFSAEFAPEDQRVGGYSQLQMKAPVTTLTNQTDPGDPPADPWGWRVIGAVGVLWKKADGNIA